MKVISTITVKHKIDGKEVSGRTLICRDTMSKDGNIYEYIKIYKMGKNCPDIPNGACGDPLFDERGKLAGWTNC